MSILALDLGQSKTVFCMFREDTGEYKFGAVGRQALRRQGRA